MKGNVSGIGNLEMVNDLCFTVIFLLSFLVLYIAPGMIGKVVVMKLLLPKTFIFEK
jgi:hypothetical protein